MSIDVKSLDLKKLTIIHYPDPLLRQKAIEITDIGPEHTALAERMTNLMVDFQGIGLAAPQVGLSIRLIVISITGKREDAEILVNPVLSDFDGWSEMEEGCLSVPGVRGKVKRAATCKVNATDLEGNHFEAEANDLAATLLQHETDHLNGKLFIDRMGAIGRIAIKRGLLRLEKEYKAK